MQNGNELYHYGRLGMKWGQHRFHNKYGALNKAGQVKRRQLALEYGQLTKINKLTKKGEKHLDDVSKKYEHLTGKPIGSHAATVIPTKKLKDMTNEEITTYNTRKQLEATYLGYQPKKEVHVSKGKKFVAGVFTKVITPVATDLGKAYLKDIAKKKLNITVPEQKTKIAV